MAIRKILQFPDLRLAQKSVAVDPASKVATSCAKDIIDTMRSMDNAAGLAAPQINEQLRIVGMYMDSTKQPTIFINPELSNLSEQQSTENEACLSVDGATFSAAVTRPCSVTVTAYDINAKQFTLDLDDFYARCIQHEIDHLNGVLFVDYLSRLKRNKLKALINKRQAHA